MGVSLERVQFKFASIIGELCSEPDVLSQFAVWLDLRLAEYKLKGSISLDCSGEEPDPIWLKGLNKKKATKLENLGRAQGSTSHSRGAVSHSQPTDSMDRNSPDVVVVKDEPSDVFPVGLHGNVDLPGGNYRSRKRSADNSPSYGRADQWSQQYSSPGMKQRRLSPQADSPSNQSLMSVLSGYQGDTHESDTMGDNSSMPVPSSASLGASKNTDSFNESTAQFSDSSFNNSQTLQDIGWVGQPGTSTDTGNSNVTVRPGTMNLLRGIVANMVLLPNGKMQPLFQEYDERHKRSIIRSKIPNIDQMPEQTSRSIVWAVRTFQRWLSIGPPKEARDILDISPSELDGYLTQFYETIKNPQSKEYKLTSKQHMRSNLEKFLRKNGYPASLNSAAFTQSQLAFKQWTTRDL